jgi:hypothetical protein
LSTPRGSYTLAFTLVIDVIVETLTKVFSSIALKTWLTKIPNLISYGLNGLANLTPQKI